VLRAGRPVRALEGTSSQPPRATATRRYREGLTAVDVGSHPLETVAEELVDELVLREFRATPPAQEQHCIVQLVCDRVRYLEWPSPNRRVRLLHDRDA